MPELSEAEARARFAAARVARLATVTPDGRPHLVPIVFALVRGGTGDAGDVVYSAVDGKPKRSQALQRLANVQAVPDAVLLADHYADDWTELWWVRADGRGRVLDPEAVEARSAVAALGERYPQHREQQPTGPVLAVDVERWTGWSHQPG